MPQITRHRHTELPLSSPRKPRSPASAMPASSTDDKHNYIERSRRWRLSLSVTAVVALSCVFLWPHSSKITSILKTITFHDANARADAVAIQPIYTTYGDNGEHYIIKAEHATIPDRGSGNIQLSNLHADRIIDGQITSIRARSGFFDNTHRKLYLESNITFLDEQDYTFKTEKATIDITSTDTYGNAPITGNGAMGTIRAQGFTISQQGQRILFTGHTQLTLIPHVLKASTH